MTQLLAPAREKQLRAVPRLVPEADEVGTFVVGVHPQRLQDQVDQQGQGQGPGAEEEEGVVAVVGGLVEERSAAVEEVAAAEETAEQAVAVAEVVVAVAAAVIAAELFDAPTGHSETE